MEAAADAAMMAVGMAVVVTVLAVAATAAADAMNRVVAVAAGRAVQVAAVQP